MEESNLLLKQLVSLTQDETNLTANLANISAFLYDQLPNVSWSGFYLFDSTEQMLILGPFQGKPACTRIGIGKGVCGQAFQTKQTIIVENVHLFPGHIACDSTTNAEIVVPLTSSQGAAVGVLDLDSRRFGRFKAKDQQFFERIAKIAQKNWD
ncbi:GAF domain-containing protein [Liquorilactobacillus sicerae]|uniref:GAF domain-containing protein n=1 Tax=Liquorilactobacillus sicerae TaxID=1416943 RepID=UPI00248154D4|nr:GAF domain-containing protein [Liquorilactobacillus sicerae]